MSRGRIQQRRYPVNWVVLGATAGALAGLAAWLQQSTLRPRVGQRVEKVRHQAGELRTEAEFELQNRREDVEVLLAQARRELNELYAQAEDFIEDARLRGQIARKKAEIRRLEAQRRIRRIA